MIKRSIPVLLAGMALAWTPLQAQRPADGLRPQRTPPMEQRREQRREMKRDFVSPAPDDAKGDHGPGLRGPGPHAGDWLRRYKNLPPDQQQRLLRNDADFQRLPAERQQKLMDRLQWFNRQSPEQQQRILNRMETWEHLTPEQRRQAVQLHERFGQLPEERRQRVHQAIARLTRMDPDERQRAMSSETFRSSFSDQEREMIGSALNLGVPPGRMKDGPGDDETRRPRENDPEF